MDYQGVPILFWVSNILINQWIDEFLPLLGEGGGE
jgi:hypothetical protein